MMWVKLTLPPRARRRWLLMTTRLSAISFAGTARTLVAVGTVQRGLHVRHDPRGRAAQRARSRRAATSSCFDSGLASDLDSGPAARLDLDSGLASDLVSGFFSVCCPVFGSAALTPSCFAGLVSTLGSALVSPGRLRASASPASARTWRRCWSLTRRPGRPRPAGRWARSCRCCSARWPVRVRAGSRRRSRARRRRRCRDRPGSARTCPRPATRWPRNRWLSKIRRPSLPRSRAIPRK